MKKVMMLFISTAVLMAPLAAFARPVRVVAYTSPPTPSAPGGEPLGSYHAALARAQAVADALRAAGIPADKVQAEAAPAASAASADRVDVQFAP